MTRVFTKDAPEPGRAYIFRYFVPDSSCPNGIDRRQHHDLLPWEGNWERAAELIDADRSIESAEPIPGAPTINLDEKVEQAADLVAAAKPR